MKKFVFLYQGTADAPDAMQAWGEWFAANSSSFVDVGNPFGEGRVIANNGGSSVDASPVTGYSIVSAESLDAAEKLLDGLPTIDSVRIYEALPM